MSKVLVRRVGSMVKLVERELSGDEYPLCVLSPQEANQIAVDLLKQSAVAASIQILKELTSEKDN